MIEYFSLPGLLPEGHVIATNDDLKTALRLTLSDGLPRLLAEVQFTGAEYPLAKAVLHSYPDYCPHEVLLASFATQAAPMTIRLRRCAAG